MALTKVSGGILQQPIDVGIITATSIQVGSGTTIHDAGIDLGSGNITSHNINSTGIVTSTGLDVNGNGDISGDLSVSGNVSIGGTLTYEDVTNIDSVGLITARDGIIVTGGSVGIGTDNPDTKLHLYGASHNLRVERTGVGPGYLDIGLSHTAADHYGSVYITAETTGNTSDFIFRHGVTGSYSEKLRIKSNGNVGIGVTNPQNRLHVKGPTGGVSARFTDAVNATILVSHPSAGKSKIADAGGNYGFEFDTASVNVLSGGSEKLRITSGGDVGIGLTNPTTNLTVYGNASAVMFQNSNTGTTGGDGFFVGNYGGLSASVWQYENDIIAFGTNNTERIRITAVGDVGIGTNVPRGGLHVFSDNTGEGPATPQALVISRASADSNRLLLGIDENSGYGVIASVDPGTTWTHTTINPTTGNVGIGLTNPSAKLHISSGGATQMLISNKSASMSDGDTIGTIDFTAGPSFTTNARVAGLVEGTSEAGGDLIFETRQDGGSLTEKLRITSGGNIGINQINPSNAKLHVVGPSSSQQEIIAKFKGGSGSDAEGRIALVAGYPDTANDIEGHVYLAARRNGSGNTSSFSVYCADNASTMTERLKVTNGGDLYLNGSNGSHRVVDEYAGSVSVTNANTDAFAFRMHGSSLGGGGRLYFWGTSGNVVVNVIADIIISHSTHICVQSISNGYTQGRLRIVTNNNESGDIYLGRHNGYASGTTILNWRFIPYGGTYVVTSGGTYVNATITHTTNSNSYTISATSGGNVNASGSKNFLIDHPLVGLSTTTKLAHAAVEGPECNTMYRGEVTLVDGTTTINLDTNSRMTEGTFEALNQNVQCYTTNETGWTPVKGSVSGNILTIIAQDITCTDTVSWLVIAERKDNNIIDSNLTDSMGRLIPEITDEYDPSQFPEYVEPVEETEESS